MAHTLAEAETGECYVFRSRTGTASDRGRRAQNREPLTLALFPGYDA